MQFLPCTWNWEISLRNGLSDSGLHGIRDEPHIGEVFRFIGLICRARARRYMH